MSDYFGVTTDYLLRGIEPRPDIPKKKVDARIFSTVGSVFNFIGFIVAIIIWKEKQTAVSVAVGLIVMAFGCLIFAMGQYIGENKKISATYFWLINVWFLSLIPISCIFNSIQGIAEGHWWTFTPTPQLGNSLINYGLCWLIYFVFCIFLDIVIQKLYQKSKGCQAQQSKGCGKAQDKGH